MNLALIAVRRTVLREPAIRARPLTVSQRSSLARRTAMRTPCRMRLTRNPNAGTVRSAGGVTSAGSAGGGSLGGGSGCGSGGAGGSSGGKLCVPVVGPGVDTDSPDQ